MTTLSSDPFDHHDYGQADPDDATVPGDWLRCRACLRYDESVYPSDGRCRWCAEKNDERLLREWRLMVVGR